MKSIYSFVLLLFIQSWSTWANPVTEAAPDPKTIRTYQTKVRMISAAFDKNDLVTSKRLLEEAESILPNQPTTINLRGAILFKEKKYEEALQVFQSLIDRDPNSYPGYFNMAEVFLAQKKYEEALDAFERINAASPRDENCLYRIVLILALKGKTDEARDRAKKLPHPGQTAAYFFANAAIEYVAGNPKKGSDWIKQSETFFPPDNSVELRKVLIENQLIKE